LTRMTNERNSLPIYSETQMFSRWWLLVIFAAALLPTIFIYIGISDKTPRNIFGPALIGPVLVALLIGFSNLKTELRPEGLSYNFFPFHLRWHFIPIEDIEKIYVRKYSPLGEYGGWGIRGFAKNRAFNVKGSMGIQLELRNGKRILFGTQKPEEWEKVIKEQFADSLT